NSPLATDLGRFRVARLAGVVGGPVPGETISTGLTTWGYGIIGANSDVTGLILGNADQPGDPAQPGSWPADMSAFQASGGYAALVQVAWHNANNEYHNAQGDWLGGVEVIRYSGYSGTTLQIAARGDAVPQL